MPPSDNNPDFDAMSPEELMAWMETLAERQGATEGFTTEQRMDIEEVDPSTVQDTGPGYIPYGMTEEDWAKKQAEEAERKAAQRAARAPEPPPPQPPAEPEPPAPQQPAAASQQGGVPDMDAMSPEELTAWLETLAERQGATEGFTTEQRMDIEEVDPSTVQDTGPGYIPYGMTEEDWAKKQAEEAERKAAQRAARTPEPPPPQPPAEPQPEPPAPQPEPAAPDTGGLDWLESLSAGTADDIEALDLSSLGDDIQSLDLGAFDSGEADPMKWLDSLVEDQGDAFDLSQALDEADDEGGDLPDELPIDLGDAVASSAGDEAEDPLEWLESLARRQGTHDDELTTAASLDVPDADTGPAASYQDYTFEEDDVAVPPSPVDALDQPDTVDPDDPVAWLESLAAAQQGHTGDSFALDDDDDYTFDELDEDAEEDSEAIVDRLNQGISDPDDIRGWMDNLLEQGAQRSDVPDYLEDEEDEDAIQAELPDWLLEQVGAPPDLDAQDAAPDDVTAQEPEADTFDLEAAAAGADPDNIPDWLLETVEDLTETEDDDIFDDETTVVATQPVTVPAIGEDDAIDLTDPWAEAFELERAGVTDLDNMPEWYAEEMRAEQVASSDLPAADLAEETLPAGEPQAVPAWMGVAGTVLEDDAGDFIEDEIAADVEAQPEDEPLPDWLREEVEQDAGFAEGDELPDWLREAGIEDPDAVPDWLFETIDADETATPEPVEAEMQAAPAPPAETIIAPQPQQPAAQAGDALETLQRAREKVSQHDVEGSLDDYEAVIRVSTQLAEVVEDLTALTRQDEHRSNPAVYRVLGDGLMRMGRLQDALDTYRRALNLL